MIRLCTMLPEQRLAPLRFNGVNRSFPLGECTGFQNKMIRQRPPPGFVAAGPRGAVFLRRLRWVAD
jgi:hypothetical protein